MENMLKTLKVLDKRNMGILYNDQGKTHSHDNKENSCSHYKMKCEKCERRYCSVQSACVSSKDRKGKLTVLNVPRCNNHLERDSLPLPLPASGYP